MLDRTSKAFCTFVAMAKKKALPKDTNKKAKSVVDQATGNDEPILSAAQILGRQGGLKGGKARAASLTKKRRVEIAKKAAAARWGSKAD